MLETFHKKHAENLSKIISEDRELHMATSGGDMSNVSPSDFFAKTNAWIEQKNSQTYAIIYDETAVGLISLVENGIGIWLASKFWGKGIGGLAMREIFAIARQRGYTEAVGVIEKSNLRSIAMCKKLGGIFKEKSETKLVVKFYI